MRRLCWALACISCAGSDVRRSCEWVVEISDFWAANGYWMILNGSRIRSDELETCETSVMSAHFNMRGIIKGDTYQPLFPCSLKGRCQHSPGELHWAAGGCWRFILQILRLNGSLMVLVTFGYYAWQWLRMVLIKEYKNSSCTLGLWDWGFATTPVTADSQQDKFTQSAPHRRRLANPSPKLYSGCHGDSTWT